MPVYRKQTARREPEMVGAHLTRGPPETISVDCRDSIPNFLSSARPPPYSRKQAARREAEKESAHLTRGPPGPILADCCGSVPDFLFTFTARPPPMPASSREAKKPEAKSRPPTTKCFKKTAFSRVSVWRMIAQIICGRKFVFATLGRNYL